jgi:hypothetical protein
MIHYTILHRCTLHHVRHCPHTVLLIVLPFHYTHTRTVLALCAYLYFPPLYRRVQCARRRQEGTSTDNATIVLHSPLTPLSFHRDHCVPMYVLLVGACDARRGNLRRAAPALPGATYSLHRDIHGHHMYRSDSHAVQPSAPPPPPAQGCTHPVLQPRAVQFQVQCTPVPCASFHAAAFCVWLFTFADTNAS